MIHPSIVKLFDVIETQTHVGLVMEYAPEGELFEYVVKNDYVEESKAQVFFAQLISSVHYMHRKQVVHRDLKLVKQGGYRMIILYNLAYTNYNIGKSYTCG